MLTQQQAAHFNTFGYLQFPQLYNADEMAIIARALEEIWQCDAGPSEQGEYRSVYVVERSPDLTRLLVADDRIYSVVSQLLGADLLWIGSEGNLCHRDSVKWHPDRKYYKPGQEHWMDFAQLKLMMYLDPLDSESGCLRVIPGSHRMPFHKMLGDQEVDHEARPFGVDGPDIPCVALASQPGDVILFNHTMWHGAFGGGKRRYIAFKFAARPTAPHHIESIVEYGGNVFDPHERFTTHEDVRIRDIARIPTA